MIKKLIKYLSALFFPICLLFIIFMNFNLYPDLDKEFNLIDLENGNHSPYLFSLLASLNLQHDGSAKDIVNVTQKNLLRPAGKERWEIEDIFKDKKDLVSNQLKNLGCVDEAFPAQTVYDYVLLLGGSAQTFRNRLSFLCHVWEKGIRFKTLVFLVGERPLDERIESREVILNDKNPDISFRSDWKFSGVLPRTESLLARLIFDQSQIPQEMRNVEIIFVDTPMQKGSDGSLKRPTTDDTVVAWLSRQSKPGSCIAISNQPFVRYQHSVLRRLLPKEFNLETVGATLSEDKTLAVQLDSVARWIFSEFHRLSANRK